MVNQTSIGLALAKFSSIDHLGKGVGAAGLAASVVTKLLTA